MDFSTIVSSFEVWDKVLYYIKYPFIIGYLIIVLLYLRGFKTYFKSLDWKKLDAIGKSIFVFFLGICLLFPIFLLAISLFFIHTLYLIFTNPWMCGSALDPYISGGKQNEK